MMQQSVTGYCRTCRKRRELEYDYLNPVWHIVPVLMTLGLWLIAWHRFSDQAIGWRCVHCGSHDVRAPAKEAHPGQILHRH